MAAARNGLLVKDSEHTSSYVPPPDYSEESWHEEFDTPELTDAEIAQLWPNSKCLPAALADKLKRLAARPKSDAKAVPVSLRELGAYKADDPDR